MNNKTQAWVAVVTVGNQALHVVGPFESDTKAYTEGRLVADGVEMFARPGDTREVNVSILPLVGNLAALVGGA